MIYNFAIAITRIHFAICKVRSDNPKPVVSIVLIYSNKLLKLSVLVKNTKARDVMKTSTLCYHLDLVAFKYMKQFKFLKLFQTVSAYLSQN